MTARSPVATRLASVLMHVQYYSGIVGNPVQENTVAPRARSPEPIDDEQPIRTGPRLSSVKGLVRAGILESFEFEGVTGLIGVAYSSAYLRLLRDRLVLADPGYVAALLIDDPVAMRMWIEREIEFLDARVIAGDKDAGSEDSESYRDRPGTPETTEADDIRAILAYLGIAGSSPEASSITGLSPDTISEVLRGERRRPTRRRRHISVAASLIQRLADGRLAATRTPDRPQNATAWLHAAVVTTPAGLKTPLEILSDTDLARQFLRGLTR